MSQRRSSRARRQPVNYVPSQLSSSQLLSGIGSGAGSGAGAGAGAGSSPARLRASAGTARSRAAGAKGKGGGNRSRGKAAPKGRGKGKGKGKASARRAAEEDDDVDMATDSEPEEVDDDSEFEDTPSPRKPARRKSTGKAAKRGGKAKKRKKTKGTVDLFDATTRWVAHISTARDLLSWLQRDEGAATTAIVEYLAKSCGVDITFSVDDVYEAPGESDSDDDGVKMEGTDLTEAIFNATTSSTQYPVQAATTKAKSAFRRGFVDLWSHIIAVLKDDLIYAGWARLVTDTAISLCGAKNHYLRYTGLVLAMSVGTALCHKAHALYDQSAQHDRMIKANKRSKKLAAKVKQLTETKRTCDKAVTYLNDWLNELFNAVVVNRYRDVRSEMRALVVEELGKWTQAYPSMFLSQERILYFVRLIFDQDAAVRYQVVQALIPLVSGKTINATVRKLIVRLKSRVLDMVFDKDRKVAVATLELLEHLSRHDMVNGDEDDADSVKGMQELLFEEDGVRRESLCKFMVRFLSCFGEDEDASGTEAAKLARSHLQLRAMAQMCSVAAEAVQGGAHFITEMVEAFWALPEAQVIHDWKAFTSLLQLDGDAEQALDESQQVFVTRMLCESVQTVVSRLALEGKQKVKPREKATLVEMHEELTTHLAAELPKLLTTFQAVPAALTCLVRLPSVFRLSSLSKAGTVSRIVTSLVDLHQRATEPEVLEAAAYGLRNLLTEGHVASRAADKAVRKVVGQMVDLVLDGCVADESASNAVEGGKPDGGDDDDDAVADQDAEVELGVNLTRLAVVLETTAACGMHKLLGTSSRFNRELFALLARRRNLQTLFGLRTIKPQDVVVASAVRILNAQLAWMMKTATPIARKTGSLGDDKATLRALVKSVQELQRDLNAAAMSQLCLPPESALFDDEETTKEASAFLAKARSHLFHACCHMQRLFPASSLAGSRLKRVIWRAPKNLADALVRHVHAAVDFQVGTTTTGDIEEAHAAEFAGDGDDEDVVTNEVDSAQLTAADRDVIQPVARIAATASPALVGAMLAQITMGGDVEATVGAAIATMRKQLTYEQLFGRFAEALEQTMERYSDENALIDRLAAEMEEADADSGAEADADDREERQKEINAHLTMANEMFDDLEALAKRLNSSLGVWKANDKSSRTVAFLRFIQHLVSYAFEEAPERFEFLQILKPFMSRVPAERLPLYKAFLGKLVESLRPEVVESMEVARSQSSEDAEDESQTRFEVFFWFEELVGGGPGDDEGRRNLLRKSPRKTPRKTPRKSPAKVAGKDVFGALEDDPIEDEEPPKSKGKRKGKKRSRGSSQMASQKSATEFDEDDVEQIRPSPSKKARATPKKHASEASGDDADADGWITTVKQPAKRRTRRRR